MTDLNVFESLLNKAGIKYNIETNLEINVGSYKNEKVVLFPYVINIEVDEQDMEHYFGYMGFYSSWYFDKDKNLVTVGHWE